VEISTYKKVYGVIENELDVSSRQRATFKQPYRKHPQACPTRRAFCVPAAAPAPALAA
jgi:hypothetical protein